MLTFLTLLYMEMSFNQVAVMSIQKCLYTNTLCIILWTHVRCSGIFAVYLKAYGSFLQNEVFCFAERRITPKISISVKSVKLFVWTLYIVAYTILCKLHIFIYTFQIKFLTVTFDMGHKQSRQITGSSMVLNLVQVYWVGYIQSHNASDRPKLFQISDKLQRNNMFCSKFWLEYHFELLK